MGKKVDYEKMMPFKDQSESFVRGFECGIIWEFLKRGDNIVGLVVSGKNKDQIKLMCDIFSYDYTFNTFGLDLVILEATPEIGKLN